MATKCAYGVKGFIKQKAQKDEEKRLESQTTNEMLFGILSDIVPDVKKVEVTKDLLATLKDNITSNQERAFGCGQLPKYEKKVFETRTPNKFNPYLSFNEAMKKRKAFKLNKEVK